jgi:hypothetical protein
MNAKHISHYISAAITMAICLFGGGRVDAAVISGPLSNSANGHLYFLLSSNTWTAAQAEAQTLGGHLVTLSDAAEDAWVFTNFANASGIARHYWIGLNDTNAEGVFQWVTGEPFTYTNWASGEPNNGGGLNQEDWVFVLKPGSAGAGAWNDSPDRADTGISTDLILAVAEVSTLPTVPVIFAQPASSNVPLGGTLQLTVGALGQGPLSIQWFKDLVQIPGTDSVALVFTNAATNLAGSYIAVVSNSFGAVTSSVAAVSVIQVATALADDFDPGIDSSVWAAFGGTVAATNFGGFVSSPNSLWFGGTGSRFARTVPVNTGFSGSIAFALRLAPAGAASSTWERVDLPSEAVVLEYLASGSSNWVTMGSYTTSNFMTWSQISLPLPAGALGPATSFRWRQLTNTGPNFDHWAIDDVAIVTTQTPAAPTIVGQPASQTNFVGSQVSFQVIATGTFPMSYQWSYGSNAIAGATNSSLVLANVQMSQAGGYWVVVSNAYGTATSSIATLAVTQPSCMPAPSGLVGWWKGEGDLWDLMGGNAGAAWQSIGYAGGYVGQGFSFSASDSGVRVPASTGMNVGLSGGLTLECWLRPNDVANRQNIMEWNNGLGTPGVHLLGLGPTEFGLGAGNLWFNVFDTSGSDHSMSAPGGTLTAGVWQHLVVTYDKASGMGRIYRNGQLVTSQSLGSFTPQTTYDFYIGRRVSGGGNTSFRGMMDEVSVYNRALSASEVAAIYAADSLGKCIPANPPVITQQPLGTNALVGGSVSFGVGAAGPGPLGYQWSYGSNAIAGATNSSLVLANVQMSQAGGYWVVVSNAYGSATSSVANLAVTLPPASARIATVTAESGGTISVPVFLVANGNENAIGFSLNFDPTVLTFSSLAPGAAAETASLIQNLSQTASGRVGLALALSASEVFPAGTQEIAVITFAIAPVTNAQASVLTFGDTPVPRQLSDVGAAALNVTYSNGAVVIASVEFEGDVSPRPGGNKSVTITDWVQIGRFVAGLDPVAGTNEFQRVDVAPRSSRGNGLLRLTDWVQAGRYAANIDPLTPLGGPTGGSSLVSAGKGVTASLGENRSVQLVNAALTAGQTNVVSVRLIGTGQENAVSLGMTFNSAVMRCVGALAGNQASGATIVLNTNLAGQVGCMVALPTGNVFPSGTNEVLKLRFAVDPEASGYAPLTLGDQPLARQVSDPLANELTATYSNAIADVTGPVPSLLIERNGGSVKLSWTSKAPGYDVLKGPGPSVTNNWITNLIPAGIVGDRHEVMLPINEDVQFFRLKKP